MKRFLAVAMLCLSIKLSQAEVKTSVIEYDHAGTKLKGFLAYDDATSGKRPGVLVVHEWWGLDDHAKDRAKKLAKLGYVAFCPDMYGEGKVVDHPKDAGEMAGMVRKNVQEWRGRANAGLKVLASQPQTDDTKLAAIGFCFGGSTALQLAYSGANLKAVATFHAALPAPSEAEGKAIKASVLVCHGADDSFISADSIAKFKAALNTAHVPLQFESYPGTVHSFTVEGADARKVPGMAYNKNADETSWKQMNELFSKAFAK
jgi:dienelactone hydrolase